MICAIFYFLYFAAFGIYTPYWTLFLRNLQFSPMQIAVLVAIPSAARIFLPPVYGYMADRWKARTSIIAVSCLAQLLPLTLILRFHSFPALVALVCAFAFFNAPVLSFAEATAQEEQEKGELDYGKTRLWGTISFIVLAVIFGRILDTEDSDWILYGFLVFLLFLSAASLWMPEGKIRFDLRHEHLREALTTPATWIFLLVAFLMYLSHGTFYGFFSIYLSELGYTDSRIGLQWAVAAGSELSIFFFASRILPRYGSRGLLAACCLAAALRWLLIGSMHSFQWLIAVQTMHAFTFGLFHITSMRLVHRLFPEGSRSFGQALYTSFSGGLGSVLGLLLSGRLWANWHGRTFYVNAVIMAGAFFLCLLMRDSRTSPESAGDAR